MLENSIEIEILKYESEATVEITASMLLVEARRRGRMLIRTKAGDVYEIKHLEPKE